MMLAMILQGYGEEIQARVKELTEELAKTLDFAKYELGLQELMNELVARMIEKALNDLMADAELLEKLKFVGGTKALRYKEYREVNVQIGNGRSIKVKAPYFITGVSPKKGKHWYSRGNQQDNPGENQCFPLFYTNLMSLLHS
jgi:hypothetical protein